MPGEDLEVEEYGAWVGLISDAYTHFGDKAFTDARGTIINKMKEWKQGDLTTSDVIGDTYTSLGMEKPDLKKLKEAEKDDIISKIKKGWNDINKFFKNTFGEPLKWVRKHWKGVIITVVIAILLIVAIYFTGVI